MHASTRAAAVGLLLCGATTALAEDHHHVHAEDLPHFTHPLLTESPTPDSKIQGRYVLDSADEEDHHELEIHGEYAWTPALSVEIAVPIAHHDGETDVGNLHGGVKMANFAFADAGIVLTTMLIAEAPTGEGSGHHAAEHWTLTPTLGGGWRNDDWEAVLLTGVATAVSPDHDPGTIWRSNASLLRHLGPVWSAIVELDYERAINGHHEGEHAGFATGGVIVLPPPWQGFMAGAGIGVPVTDSDSDVRVVVSSMWHF